MSTVTCSYYEKYHTNHHAELYSPAEERHAVSLLRDDPQLFVLSGAAHKDQQLHAAGGLTDIEEYTFKEARSASD